MTTDTADTPVVDGDWLETHLDDPQVRVIGVHLDPDAFNAGHIAGSVSWPAIGTVLLEDYRHNFAPDHVARLLGGSGIGDDTTVVVYSEHPAIAPWVYWYLRTIGHDRVRVLDGGLSRWTAEKRPLTTDATAVAAVEYHPKPFDDSRQARIDDVRAAIDDPASVLLDVRTAEEHRGELFMLEPPVGDERAGHIPDATHVYYEETLTGDATFRPVEELTELYAQRGVTPDRSVITYCAVGMRSAQAWFVLSELLGYPDVRSYDRSWNEWGRLADTPID